MEKPAVVGGGEVERPHGMDARFGNESGQVRQPVGGLGAEEPIGHTLDDEVVVVAPSQTHVPRRRVELVVPPALGGKHDVHGFEHCAAAAVAALDELGNIAVANAKMEVDMAGIPRHLQSAGEFLQVERGEMAEEVAVLQRQPATGGRGEERGLSAEFSSYAVAAGIFGPHREAECRGSLPVQDEGAAADVACGVVEIVEAIARKGQLAAGDGLLLPTGCRDGRQGEQ